jgi:hypothetical protein
MSAAFLALLNFARQENSHMGKFEIKRLKPSLLRLDKDCLTALEQVAGYAPINVRYALAAISTAHDDVAKAQQTEAQANATAAAARQNAIAKEWEFHNLMLGAKDQVVAQFGRDSNEAQAVGLKKKSEYKKRARKAAKD